MSRRNKVNPGRYKVAGRLSPDDLGRERRRQQHLPASGEHDVRRPPLPFWQATDPNPPLENVPPRPVADTVRTAKAPSRPGRTRKSARPARAGARSVTAAAKRSTKRAAPAARKRSTTKRSATKRTATKRSATKGTTTKRATTKRAATSKKQASKKATAKRQTVKKRVARGSTRAAARGGSRTTSGARRAKKR